MDYLMNNWPQILEMLAAVVGVFAMIATFTPNENDNIAVDKALRLINVLGANVGNAKNEDMGKKKAEK